MNLLLVREISPEINMPDFGVAFLTHMETKTHPAVHASSLSAWALLAEGLKGLGEPAHTVAFSETGKPYFTDSPLHFSLSHSGSFAAALIADSPCGVDIEQLRKVKDGLIHRCMHPDELVAGMDFFEAWTKKECLAKLNGSGMRSHPCSINSLEYEGWFSRRLKDSGEKQYRLCAICGSGEEIYFGIPNIRTGL